MSKQEVSAVRLSTVLMGRILELIQDSGASEIEAIAALGAAKELLPTISHGPDSR